MRAKELGLTLVEIMIVLIILGLVMTLLGGKLFKAGDKAKRSMTEIGMEGLKQSIAEFQLRYNALPSSLDDLISCSELTGPGCAPIVSKDALEDAWESRFIYNLSGDGRTYRIQSLGADKQQGGEQLDYDIFVEGP